jgi:UDP-glucose 4-epimerase
MTILVTGAAGYIGSQIVHTLHRTFEQPKLIGLDNLSAPKTCALPNGVQCLFGEIGDRKFMVNVLDRFGVTKIIHCAAKVIVPESVEHPLRYYKNNVSDTMTLLEAAVEFGCDFIFSSTAAVYGEADLRVGQLREDDACRPVSPYGAGKLMIEQVLDDLYHSDGLRSVCLRYFNVAGADPLGLTGPNTEAASHLIPRVVRAGMGLIPTVFVTGDGNDRRDYIHVADVAAANMAALEWTGRYTEPLTVNVGRGVPVTINDVIAEVEHQLGKKVPVTPAPRRREGDPRECVANVKLIKERFNWEPQYSLRQIVEHAISWENSLQRSTTTTPTSPSCTRTIPGASMTPAPVMTLPPR